MRIVHLYDGHEKVNKGEGSVPSVVWSVAEQAASKGHDVTIIERQWRGLNEFETREGVTFRRLSLRTGATEPWTDIPHSMVRTPWGGARLLVDRINFAFAAYRLLRSMSFDVLHVHLPFAANVLATTVPSLADKMVYTAHIGKTNERVVEPRVSPDVYLAKRAKFTIVLNTTMRQAFIQKNVSKSKLPIIPNGVDIPRFRDTGNAAQQSVCEAYSIGDESVILFVGSVTPRKGIHDLVRAVSGVIDSGHDDVILLITGTTDLEPEYVRDIREQIAKAGIDNKVVFTGYVSEKDLLGLYALADVFAFPSYEEGSSIAVAEAMASGTPIVGTQIDGISEMIQHDVHGLLSKPGDIDGLTKNLNRILENPAERERIQTAIQNRAQELSWSQITDEIIDVYNRVIGG